MTTIAKAFLATSAGPGLVALAAVPRFAGPADNARTTRQVQIADMGHGYGGQGYGGQGLGHASCAGAGTMGPGMGTMGPGYGYGPRFGGPRQDLSADGIRDRLERSPVRHGDERLKVGEVNEVDEDTVLADIVSLDKSLVQRLAIDWHAGRTRQVERPTGHQALAGSKTRGRPDARTPGAATGAGAAS